MKGSVGFQGSLVNYKYMFVKKAELCGDEERLTQAISNRVFRAADSSITPIATLTPSASKAPTELCFESGGPGSLNITKVSLSNFC